MRAVQGSTTVSRRVACCAPEGATMLDLDALIALEAGFAPGERISRRSWRRFLSGHNEVLVCRDENGRSIAASVLLFRRGSRIARLYSLAVDPGYRGKGYAMSLLTACEAVALRHECNTVRLEVAVSNFSAIALYQRAGYVDLQRLPGYYSDGGDAIRMMKNLQKEKV